MKPSEAAELLGRALREDRLVALVGARASASTQDASGRPYEGLPTPVQFVESCAMQFGYIERSDSFNGACDKILDRDGRQKLEDLLLRYYRVPDSFAAPPAHGILAWLPFSIYLTSNYDEFIERSLEREGRLPHCLVEDIDLLRLKRRHTAVVKYHGTVTRPSTMVAATRDYDLLEKRRGLVGDFVASSLAGKIILVIGHGLGDSDLGRILDGLDERLGEYAPAIYVLRPPDHDGRFPTLSKSPEVVLEDVTQFLSRLLQQARHTVAHVHSSFNEAWLSSAFFAALRKAAVLPSETQVIDAFLLHLQEEIAARGSVPAVLADADAAVRLALEERPTYEALRKTWGQVMAELNPLSVASDAEIALQTFRDGRALLIGHFRRLGSYLIKRNERILLYSQSQRVIQVLLGVPTTVQRTIHLFVAECRPKSPLPYQDAIATCQQLADTAYSITVCPDVVAGHLLASHQLDRFIMGTHAIFRDGPTSPPHAFVNTCGARLLVEAALSHKVPVEVIGEVLKIEEVASADATDHLHIHQENDLLQSAVGLRDIATTRGDVKHLNIGYDLVPVGPGISVHVPDHMT